MDVNSFIWVLLIIILVLNLVLASEFQRVADEKGFGDSNKYFWYTFLFSIIGMLLVIALPDRNSSPTVVVTREENNNQNNKSQDKRVDEELPDI